MTMPERKPLTPQVALADKLKQLAIDTKNDSAASYVMFTQALEFAIKGGDPTVAMAVIDAIAKSFDLDAWDLRQKTLAHHWAHAAKAEDVRALVVHSAIELGATSDWREPVRYHRLRPGNDGHEPFRRGQGQRLARRNSRFERANQADAKRAARVGS